MTSQPDLLEDLPGEGIAARTAALAVLSGILGQKKMLDTVLEKEPAFTSLEQRDRAFVRMLVATTLRRKGQLDDLLARALNKGEEPRPDTLRWIIYLGMTQILFMDVADYAAVDTSVALVEMQNLSGKKGFVNAILRRMTSDGKAWLAAQDEAALNVPDWLYRQWIGDYGFVRAKDIALACLTEASLDITVKDAGERDRWARDLATSILPTGTLRRPAGGNVTALPGFADGAWWVQDASSALPAKIMGDVAGKTVLDLCAAPGGKAMQLAAAGANVVALDRSASRMATLDANFKRAGLSQRIRTVIDDGAAWRPKEKFSHILLDAPCTATGTIRRHPDLLALKSEKDQTGLMSIQARLLANAAELLAPGGLLIYCTCSLQKAEGEAQVSALLASRPDLRRMPVRKEELGNIDGIINGDGDIRVLPYHLKEQGGMDGFYISRMIKTG